MATTFSYEATDRSGKRVKGTVQAVSEGEVVADLRRRVGAAAETRISGGVGRSGRMVGRRVGAAVVGRRSG